MSTEGSGASRAGGENFHNEDAFLVEEGLGLYVVCDGFSGTPAGEIASRTAVEALEEFVSRAEEDIDLRGERVARAVVERAMVHAMAALTDASSSDPDLRGLGTTVTMLLALGDTGVIGHRGDSRAYLVRRDRLRQLTIDDDVTRGADASTGEAGFDVFSLELSPGDTLILCTDGAEEVVGDGSLVRAAGDLSPRILASRIVSAAQRRAPGQDATAVVVRVKRDVGPGWFELSDAPLRTAFGHTLAVPAG